MRTKLSDRRAGMVGLFVLLNMLWMFVWVPSAPAADNTTKAAFVYVGPVGDAGWTFQHDQGRKYLEEVMGEKVETTFVENVSAGAEAERVFEDLAQKGYDVIFGTSFGFMDPMVKVAQRHPDVYFEHCSGYKTTDNLNNYLGRMYQPRYLAGMIAGSMTDNDLIGMVAAHPIPEVIREINAFALGARSVNPDATVKVIWSNTWYDPAKEKDAAMSLLEAGADVLAQYQDSPAVGQAAQEEGAFWIGSNSDMRRFAPEAYLTSTVWDWGYYYVDTVREIRNGSWTVDEYWGGIDEGIAGLAPISDKVPHEVEARVLNKQRQLLAGHLDVFKGPIRDQEGTVRIAEGEVPDRETLWAMDWFVEGVEGSTP